jgi:hypothetical protein
MAKIITKTIIVKFSKIVKDNEIENSLLINDELSKTLEEVAQEMCSSDIVVEVEEGKTNE